MSPPIQYSSYFSLAHGERFSRACRACHRKEPRKRAVAVACGHAVCARCAYDEAACPLCGVPTTFVHLFEEKTSRECHICLTEAPKHRVFFENCGHLTCFACSLQMDLSSNGTDCPLACPLCRTTSTLVPYLVEQLADDVGPQKPQLQETVGSRHLEHLHRQGPRSSRPKPSRNHHNNPHSNRTRLQQPRKQNNSPR